MLYTDSYSFNVFLYKITELFIDIFLLAMLALKERKQSWWSDKWWSDDLISGDLMIR